MLARFALYDHLTCGGWGWDAELDVDLEPGRDYALLRVLYVHAVGIRAFGSELANALDADAFRLTARVPERIRAVVFLAGFCGGFRLCGCGWGEGCAEMVFRGAHSLRG